MYILFYIHCTLFNTVDWMHYLNAFSSVCVQFKQFQLIESKDNCQHSVNIFNNLMFYGRNGFLFLYIISII